MKRPFFLLALVYYVLPFLGGSEWAAYAQNPGNLDISFNIGTGANGVVFTTVVQPDGKIIIGGDFTSYNGTAMNRIARIHADGSLDGSFIIGAGADDEVSTISLQPDGKIIMGGSFTSYNGTARNSIARLNVDGTLDGSFISGSGASGSVMTSAIQLDGKIIIGGHFTHYNGTAMNRIARLNADGTLDSSFIVGAGADGYVVTTEIQPDGKIIMGGYFTSYGGTAINRIARLNADGSLDGSFTVGTGVSGEVSPQVLVAGLLPDGKVIISGPFSSYDGTSVNNIARLNADGTLDVSFTVGTGMGGYLLTAAIQPDGKIIVGGLFSSYNGTAVNSIARLNADGTLDGSFTVGEGADSYVATTSIQPDGKIIMGGYFTSYDGTARNRVARLHGGEGVGVVDMVPSGFSIFPNPGNGLFTIVTSEGGAVRLTVTDISGREVFQENYTATPGTARSIDISKQANGIYTLRIETEKGNGGVRLVKE